MKNNARTGGILNQHLEINKICSDDIGVCYGYDQMNDYDFVIYSTAALLCKTCILTVYECHVLFLKPNKRRWNGIRITGMLQ